MKANIGSTIFGLAQIEDGPTADGPAGMLIINADAAVCLLGVNDRRPVVLSPELARESKST